jgi:L-lactate utilization protein LutB
MGVGWGVFNFFGGIVFVTHGSYSISSQQVHELWAIAIQAGKIDRVCPMLSPMNKLILSFRSLAPMQSTEEHNTVIPLDRKMLEGLVMILGSETVENILSR